MINPSFSRDEIEPYMSDAESVSSELESYLVFLMLNFDKFYKIMSIDINTIRHETRPNSFLHVFY